MNKKDIDSLQLALDKELLRILKEEFGFNIVPYNGMYSGRCLIHGGDRQDNLSLYLNQDTIKWNCFSKKCHDIFIGSSIGLIRGLLSKRNGWNDRGDETVSFWDTIQFIREKLGGEPVIEASRIKEPEQIVLGTLNISREQVRSRLKIPSPYFLKRGFSPEILDFYDVGPSLNPVKKTYFREVVPIYEPQGQYCIGCSARTTFNICPKCSCYHDPKFQCPPSEVARLYSKWKNLNFKIRYSLYNYWNLPQTLKSLIVVEGPGNVWKLREAGIHSVVGIYSANRINEYKQKLIKDKGVDHLYLGFDNDEAGEYAFQENGRLLWDKFHIHKLSPLNNDFGDMTVKEIKRYVIPQLKGWQ